MINENSLMQLMSKYKQAKSFDDLFSLANQELNAVLDKEREYPPFMYYLCLEHIDNNPNYKNGKSFSKMTNEEKSNIFNEVIIALKALVL